jgi:hypothetical protein
VSVYVHTLVKWNRKRPLKKWELSLSCGQHEVGAGTSGREMKDLSLLCH